MAIILREIQSDAPGGVLARVEHGGRELLARVSGDPERLRAAVGTTLIAEIDYASVVGARELPTDRLEDHGIHPLPSGDAGDVRFLGSVHSKTDVPDGDQLVDIYSVTGPDFLTVEATALGCNPDVGTGIEVVLSGLCFFPTWT